MYYFLHIIILVLIFGALALSLDLLVGQAGVLAICQGAFAGLGAYSVSILTSSDRMPFLAALGTGIALAGFLGYFLGRASHRLRGDALVLATLGFQMVVFNTMNDWRQLTRGPLGIAGIPAPNILGWYVSSVPDSLMLSAAVLAVSLSLYYLVVQSPFGNLLRGLREDEHLVSAMGNDPAILRGGVFAVSAGVAALAGGVLAPYLTYIDPSTFSVDVSILVLSMVVIGGAGGVTGPTVGAAILIVTVELLRFLGLEAPLAADIREACYGLALVVVIMLRPSGLWGRYAIGG